MVAFHAPGSKLKIGIKMMASLYHTEEDGRALVAAMMVGMEEDEAEWLDMISELTSWFSADALMARLDVSGVVEIDKMEAYDARIRMQAVRVSEFVAIAWGYGDHGVAFNTTLLDEDGYEVREEVKYMTKEDVDMVRAWPEWTC